MNELRRPERGYSVCVVRTSQPTRTARALHIIITDVQLMAAGKGYNMLLYICIYIYIILALRAMLFFFPDLADIPN